MDEHEPGSEHMERQTVSALSMLCPRPKTVPRSAGPDELWIPQGLPRYTRSMGLSNGQNIVRICEEADASRRGRAGLQALALMTGETTAQFSAEPEVLRQQ